MVESARFNPSVDKFGKQCIHWSLQLGCTFPKAEMKGRRSCEGVIDDVCLYLKDGRVPKSLNQQQLLEIKTRIPGSNLMIPPGDINP